jgi:hypothetical protein
MDGSGGEDEHDSCAPVAREFCWLEEEFSSCEGGGWVGLRGALRSKTLRTVEAAILDDTLSDGCVGVLVEHCHHEDAVREAEVLLLAWISRSDRPTTEHRTRLNQLCQSRRRDAVKFRILGSHVREHPARLGEMVKMFDPWNDILKAASRGAYYEAVGFLYVCVEVYIEAEHTLPMAQAESLSKNIREVLSKLCCMSVVLLLTSESHPGSLHLSEALYRMASSIMLSESSSLSISPLSRACLLGPVLLTSLAAGSILPGDILNTRDLSSASTPFLSTRAKTTRSIQDFAALFASDFVDFIVRADLTTTSAFVNRILSALQQQQRHPSPPADKLLRHIGMEVIAAYRETSVDRRHDFEEELQAIMTSPPPSPSPSPTQTPIRGIHKCAPFRWDDGLCEWIAKTPFAQKPPSSKTTIPNPIREPASPQVHIPPHRTLASRRPPHPTPDTNDDKENRPFPIDDDALTRSPDVLALLPSSSPPPAKKPRSLPPPPRCELPLRRPMAALRTAHPKVIVPRLAGPRRRMGCRMGTKTTWRVWDDVAAVAAAKEEEEDSGDELGH